MSEAQARPSEREADRRRVRARRGLAAGLAVIGIALAPSGASAIDIVRLETSRGTVEIALFSDVFAVRGASDSVNSLVRRFRRQVLDGTIVDTIIHDAQEGSVVPPGGGSPVNDRRLLGGTTRATDRLEDIGLGASFTSVPNFAHLRGTVAMGLFVDPEDPDRFKPTPPLCSVPINNEWLVNIGGATRILRDTDGGEPLVGGDGRQLVDSATGQARWRTCPRIGRPVIGQVIGNGLTVLTQIMNLPREDGLFVSADPIARFFPSIPVDPPLEPNPAGYGCLTVLPNNADGTINVVDDCDPDDADAQEAAIDALQADLGPQLLDRVVRVESAEVVPVLKGVEKIRFGGLKTISGRVKPRLDVAEWALEIIDDGTWRAIDVTPEVAPVAATATSIPVQVRDELLAGAANQTDAKGRNFRLVPGPATEAQLLANARDALIEAIARTINPKKILGAPAISADVSFAKFPTLRVAVDKVSGLAILRGRMRLEGTVTITVNPKPKGYDPDNPPPVVPAPVTTVHTGDGVYRVFLFGEITTPSA